MNRFSQGGGIKRPVRTQVRGQGGGVKKPIRINQYQDSPQYDNTSELSNQQNNMGYYQQPVSQQPNFPQPQQVNSFGNTFQNGLGLNLSKGQQLNLSKEVPNLSSVRVGLGWNVNSMGGQEYDLDAQAILLDASGRMRDSDDLIFFNNLRSKCGSIVHQGDNRTGTIGENDDEIIDVFLQQVPMDVIKIVFVVTIHDAKVKRQNFGQVSNAYIRLVNQINNQPIARFNLTENYSTSISVIVGEFYRYNNQWNFNAIGQGRFEDLGEICQLYGL